MWEYLENTIFKIDKENTFYCGYGAGRPFIKVYNKEADKLHLQLQNYIIGTHLNE